MKISNMCREGSTQCSQVGCVPLLHQPITITQPILHLANMRDADCLRHCYAGVIAIVGYFHIWSRNYQIDLLTPTRSVIIIMSNFPRFVFTGFFIEIYCRQSRLSRIQFMREVNLYFRKCIACTGVNLETEKRFTITQNKRMVYTILLCLMGFKLMTQCVIFLSCFKL